MMMPSIFNSNLFDDWMDFTFPEVDKKLYGKQAANIMQTDIKETEHNYEVSMNLPGFQKDEIHAELKDGYLVIHAEKNVNNDEKNKEGRYIRRERYTGNMSRSFYIGKEITQDEIHAKFKNGILVLDIPKKDKKKEVEEKQYVTIEG